MDTIPFGRPMLDADEIAAVTEVLSGPVLVHGPRTKAFEAAFAARIGARFAVGVSSCTAALHLALHVEGVGPGDEVIVPAMTHVATAHAASFCGAKPVFADVLAESGNLDPDAVAAVRTRRTRAVMPVHYLGLPCAMDRITAAAGEALVIEDCALALDATFDGRKAGTLGRAGCFSFYPVKHMTTVEGGMLTTDDEDLARRVVQARAFGYDRALGERAKPGIYDVTVLGYNYRMNEVTAAIGLTQVAKLDRFQRARAANFAALRAALADIDEATVFAPTQGRAVSSHYCLNAVLPRDGRIDRDAVIAALAARGVGASVHYPKAVPLMAYYRERYGHRDGAFPIAEWLAAQSVSLPVGPHLKPGDPARIAAALKDAVREGRRA